MTFYRLEITGKIVHKKLFLLSGAMFVACKYCGPLEILILYYKSPKSPDSHFQLLSHTPTCFISW